jgi:hypothetical protein
MLDLYNRQKLMTEKNFFKGENLEGEFGNEIPINKDDFKGESMEKSNVNEENKNLGGEVEIPSDDKLFGEIKGEEIKNEPKSDEGEGEGAGAGPEGSHISNNKLVSIDKIEDIQKDPNEENDANKLENDVKNKISEIKKCEDTILSIIDHIFNLSSPRMTIKIGFIYLAEILEFYPELAKNI